MVKAAFGQVPSGSMEYEPSVLVGYAVLIALQLAGTHTPPIREYPEKQEVAFAVSLPLVATVPLVQENVWEYV